MLRNDYEKFLKLQQEISDKIYNLKDELGIDSCCSPVEYDETGVTLEGDEYWSYGGHEHHRGFVPVEKLFDNRKDIIADILTDLGEGIDTFYQDSIATLSEEDRRKVFLKLQSEFSN